MRWIFTIALIAWLFLLAVPFFWNCEEAHALGGSSLGKPDNVYHFNPNGKKVKHSKIADADGRVPEFHVCGFNALGMYSYHTDARGETQGVIRINVCAHKRLDHRVWEWRETIEHERLHARGYSLGERGR